MDNFTPQSSYTKEELLDCSQGNLFGEKNGRQPTPNMLMFDRIEEINKSEGRDNKGKIIAELDINPDLWFFDCHFKGDPVMPGCLGLDAMWQLVGFYLCWLGNPGKGRALGSSEAKFFGQVLPTAKKVTTAVKPITNKSQYIPYLTFIKNSNPLLQSENTNNLRQTKEYLWL